MSGSPSLAETVFPRATRNAARAWFLAFAGIALTPTLMRRIATDLETKRASTKVAAVDEQARAKLRNRFKRLLAGIMPPENNGLPLRTRVRPARSIRYDGAGEAGRFPSYKVGHLVSFESSLERQLIETLDAVDEVEWYVEQPVRIPFEFRGESCVYVPDFLVHMVDGAVLLVEVKSVFATALLQNMAKFSAALDYCRERGWGFLVTDPARGSNVLRLARLADDVFEQDLISLLGHGPLTFFEYKRRFPDAASSALTAAIVRHGLELEQPFLLSFPTGAPCQFSIRAAKQMAACERDIRDEA